MEPKREDETGGGQKVAFFHSLDGVEEWVGGKCWCSFNEVEGNPGLGLVS